MVGERSAKVSQKAKGDTARQPSSRPASASRKTPVQIPPTRRIPPVACLSQSTQGREAGLLTPGEPATIRVSSSTGAAVAIERVAFKLTPQDPSIAPTSSDQTST